MFYPLNNEIEYRSGWGNTAYQMNWGIEIRIQIFAVQLSSVNWFNININGILFLLVLGFFLFFKYFPSIDLSRLFRSPPGT